MFRPNLRSRRAMLAATKGLILSSPPLPKTAGGGPRAFCLDPRGTDNLLTPQEVLELACGDCKKFAVLWARRAIDSGKYRSVDVCMTVTGEPEEHMFLRFDAGTDQETFSDPAVEEGGMPIRDVGAFIAERVWPV